MDLVVVCVPTPSKDDGSADISFIEDILSRIKNKIFVLIKSTIPPNTTNNLSKTYPHLRLVFSPEYIGESNYNLPYPYNFNKEVIKTPYFIFGGNLEDTTEIVDIFTKIAGPVKEYIQTTSLNAEICKYMENCFLRLKSSFVMNSIKYAKPLEPIITLCERFGSKTQELLKRIPLYTIKIRINVLAVNVCPKIYRLLLSILQKRI